MIGPPETEEQGVRIEHPHIESAWCWGGLGYITTWLYHSTLRGVEYESAPIVATGDVTSHLATIRRLDINATLEQLTDLLQLALDSAAAPRQDLDWLA